MFMFMFRYLFTISEWSSTTDTRISKHHHQPNRPSLFLISWQFHKYSNRNSAISQITKNTLHFYIQSLSVLSVITLLYLQFKVSIISIYNFLYVRHFYHYFSEFSNYRHWSYYFLSIPYTQYPNSHSTTTVISRHQSSNYY